MTYAELRLAQLDAISRARELSEEEQREVMLRAKQDRNNRRRKARYWLDPAYRQHRIQQAREARA